MQKSKFLQRIGGGETSLFYHSLFGKLFLLNNEYIQVLENKNLDDLVGENNTSIVQELVDNNYLVDDEVNERNILKQKNTNFLSKVISGDIVTSLDLNISELCNFTCPHCMNGCQIQNIQDKLMPYKTAKVAIDAYKEIIGKNKNKGRIHFGSAEPLANWEVLKQSILYCRDALPETPIAINTNLALLTESRAIFLRDQGVFIASSLDGPKNGNNLIRTQRSGGTYTIIMDKIRLLRRLNYPLDGISITMNDLNIDSVDEDFIVELKSLGFTGIATDIDLVNKENCSNSVGFYVDKLINIYKLCKKHGMDNFGSWSLIYSNLVNQASEELLTYCKSQRGYNLSVNPEGNIFICGYSISKIGNIFNYKEIFKTQSNYVSLVGDKLPGEQSMCFGCELEGICSGQCLVSLEFNDKKKLDFLCDFYRMITSRLLEIKLESELFTN